jgi:hypothetical protein
MKSLPRRWEWVAAKDFRAASEAAESQGEFLFAYDIAFNGLRRHTDDEMLKYLAVRSLARSGATEQAIDRYTLFGLARSEDEDTAALWARLLKDRALAAGGNERPARLAEAAESYEAVYRRTKGIFPGINAATLKLLAGDPEAASSIATEISKAAAKAKPSDALGTYYAHATVAEAALLLDDADGASRALQEAAAAIDAADYAAMETTRRQLTLICDAKGISRDVLAALRGPGVINYLGHMIAGAGTRGSFPADLESEVAAGIAAYLDDHRVGVAFGALASGADILFAEALLERDAALHVVLPFHRDRFRDISVAGAGADWGARFDRCLDRARSVRTAVEDDTIGMAELFAYGARYAMGLAILHARQIGAEVWQAAVWDQQPPEGEAGTSVDVALWRSKGGRTDVIAVEPADGGGNGGAKAGGADTPSTRLERSILFGEFESTGTLRDHQLPAFRDHVLGAVISVLDRHAADLSARDSWGERLCAVFENSVVAARTALEMQEAVAALDMAGLGLPEGLGLRIGGHRGLVMEGLDPIRREPMAFGSEMARALRMEPAIPSGAVYVSEAFAASLALEAPDDLACEYVGHMPAEHDEDPWRMFVVRSITD